MMTTSPKACMLPVKLSCIILLAVRFVGGLATETKGIIIKNKIRVKIFNYPSSMCNKKPKEINRPASGGAHAAINTGICKFCPKTLAKFFKK